MFRFKEAIGGKVLCDCLSVVVIERALFEVR
jgi:hypothetical protein